MKYFRAFSILALITLGQPALSNCWNRDGMEDQVPPRLFTTCLGDYCIEDELEYACASASWIGARFRGGLSISCTPESSGTGYDRITTIKNCTYSIGGYELSTELQSLLSCTPKNVSDSGCSWFP